MVVAPIYRDTIYVYSGSSLNYHITLDGETIFEGRAYAAPGEDNIQINVNRICENYLNNNAIEAILNGTSTLITAPEAYREFILLDSGNTALETFGFLYDYDYEGDFVSGGTGMVLSNPVNGKTAENMITFHSSWDGTTVRNMNAGFLYTGETVCDAEFALYYLNARGGWDAFVIEGAAIRTDKVDRHQYNKTYNNQTIEYEKNTYISEISSSWRLSTGLLDDAQAHNLCWNLLSSNRVYLHDLKENRIIPVIITNTDNVYNTYRNNGHQTIQYEIAVSESQTKLRQ